MHVIVKEAKCDKCCHRSNNVWRIHTIAICIVILILLGNVFAVSGQMRQGDIVSAVAPVYPKAARLFWIDGTVVVETLVSSQGSVDDAKIIQQSSEYGFMFREAVEKTAKRWKFVTVAKSNALRKYLITFQFIMMPSNTPEEELASVFSLPFEVSVFARKEGPQPIHPRPIYDSGGIPYLENEDKK
jgi:TonB family protein